MLSSVTPGTDYGNVELDEDYRILSFQEKTKHSEGQLINAGVYCLQHDMIRQQSEGKASTSFLQRKLQIGYNRAARIVDMMEDDGIISKPNHVGKREIL